MKDQTMEPVVEPQETQDQHEPKRLNAATDGDGAPAPKQEMVRELSADQILNAPDIEIDPVDVPEWGGRVYVRSMTSLQREKYLDSMRKVIGEGAKATMQTVLQFGSAKLLALTLCDLNGKLLFNPTDVATIEKLAKKSAKASERCVAKAAKMNGLDDTGEKEKNGSAVPMESGSGFAID
jgi:hypothetical protein